MGPHTIFSSHIALPVYNSAQLSRPATKSSCCIMSTSCLRSDLRFKNLARRKIDQAEDITNHRIAVQDADVTFVEAAYADRLILRCISQLTA